MAARLFLFAWFRSLRRIPQAPVPPAPHLRVTYPPPAPLVRPQPVPRPFAPQPRSASSQPPQPPAQPVQPQPAQPQPASPQRQPRPVPASDARLLAPRLRRMLEWVVSALPEDQRTAVFAAFLETLRFRAALEQRCSLESEQPVGRERFGPRGETLIPEGTMRVRAWLDEEVRETLHTCERRLSRTRRNYYLAMHSARLGQLWAELECRFDIEVLEEVRHALGRRWV